MGASLFVRNVRQTIIIYSDVFHCARSFRSLAGVNSLCPRSMFAEPTCIQFFMPVIAVRIKFSLARSDAGPRVHFRIRGSAWKSRERKKVGAEATNRVVFFPYQKTALAASKGRDQKAGIPIARRIGHIDSRELIRSAVEFANFSAPAFSRNSSSVLAPSRRAGLDCPTLAGQQNQFGEKQRRQP